jgi:hypothetical protein
MNYLISALIVSVAIEIALPAWAQAPMTQSRGHHHHGYSQYQNHMANRLNAEELATLQGAAPVHRMPYGGKQLTSPR